MTKANVSKYFILTTVFLFPTFILAQGLDLSAAGTNFKTVIYYVVDVINILTPVLFAIAFIIFFWGVSKVILNSNKPEDRKNGRNYMIWGVFVLFVLLSFQAIIIFISGKGVLDIGGSASPPDVLLKTK